MGTLPDWDWTTGENANAHGVWSRHYLEALDDFGGVQNGSSQDLWPL